MCGQQRDQAALCWSLFDSVPPPDVQCGTQRPRITWHFFRLPQISPVQSGRYVVRIESTTIGNSTRPLHPHDVYLGRESRA